MVMLVTVLLRACSVASNACGEKCLLNLFYFSFLSFYFTLDLPLCPFELLINHYQDIIAQCLHISHFSFAFFLQISTHFLSFNRLLFLYSLPVCTADRCLWFSTTLFYIILTFDLLFFSQYFVHSLTHSPSLICKCSSLPLLWKSLPSLSTYLQMS